MERSLFQDCWSGVLVVTGLLLWGPLPADAQPDWTQLTTVQEVYEAYPSDVRQLLAGLDLSRPGLENVWDARAEGRFVEAARQLLTYYRTAETASWLRGYAPASDEDVSGARRNLKDQYRFYGQADTVPRREDGGLEWTHRGPADDIEWALALNRHFHLEQLLNAYLVTREDTYVQRLDRDLRDWIVNSRPYPAEKKRGPVWGGLQVSFRVEVWAKIFFALQQDEHLQPGTRLLMLMSLQDHAHYLRHLHSGLNWVTMELSGLTLLAVAWPEFEAAEVWRRYAEQTLGEELDRQLYPDGALKELTVGYHRLALSNFEQLYTLAQRAGHSVPQSYRRNLIQMYRYLASVLRPNGTGPLNNDSDLRAFDDELLAAAARYDRPQWRYVATQGAEGRRPEWGPSRMLPWAGQLVSRGGWTAGVHWSLFDIGPWGTAHQHNDKLHLSVHAYGRDVLVDAGRFAYEGDIARRFRVPYAKHTRGHNAVMIDGHGQSPGPREAESPVPVSRAFTTTQYDFARGSVDHFENVRGAVEHKRAVLYVRDQVWVVVDRITTDRPRTVETLWHFHPDCTTEQEGASIRTTDENVGNVRVQAADENWTVELVKGQLDPHPQGWYSPRYNQYTEATAAVARRRVDGTATFAWLIVPGQGTVPTSWVRLTGSTSNQARVQFRVGDDDWWAAIPLRGDQAPRLISQSLE